MKAVLLMVFLWLAGAPDARPLPLARHRPAAAHVYVCISKLSVAYHTAPDCRGLAQCTHHTRQVTVKVARKLGKRACQLCVGPGVAVGPGQ